ncbi:MAG: hypothetical protein C9356_02565 [Oleiphilus sp.]|nr:MAG: hypothetical protein C9356_02565 [Oleiphilus sp.]
MINGKGAAHDADVLVTPPIQMPFSYPFRLNFECKAYSRKTDLSVIRNALGLRYDINEFEVVTREQLVKRKNNRRSPLAIDNRQRFNYQVGVASVEEFSKPAFEFAANNKIPLLSIRWFLPPYICDLFHQITSTYVNQFSRQDMNALLMFLKGESSTRGKAFIEGTDSIFKTIYDAFLEFERVVVVGLLESGDLLFLFAENSQAIESISGTKFSRTAKFHYEKRNIDYWSLDIEQNLKFGFYLPANVVALWGAQGFSQGAAADIKAKFFSKIFIFVKGEEMPFRIIRIDRNWLNKIVSDE